MKTRCIKTYGPYEVGKLYDRVSSRVEVPMYDGCDVKCFTTKVQGYHVYWRKDVCSYFGLDYIAQHRLYKEYFSHKEEDREDKLRRVLYGI